MWRDTIERILRLETDEVDALRNFIAKADKIDEVRRYSAMLVHKIEIVTMLNELLHYCDKETINHEPTGT